MIKNQIVKEIKKFTYFCLKITADVVSTCRFASGSIRCTAPIVLNCREQLVLWLGSNAEGMFIGAAGIKPKLQTNTIKDVLKILKSLCPCMKKYFGPTIFFSPIFIKLYCKSCHWLHGFISKCQFHDDISLFPAKSSSDLQSFTFRCWQPHLQWMQ